ncbi:short-chain dehydrogenase/reductase SDR [Caballeronia catudaia]|uniref:Short-chain dehydrogenase/reductase SDR n=1 Tax=Caballeronia catudaia TaxID=1777136 RepID=A0A158BEB0_9BURK|nr:short-chain dehydrogenase/reductase SDR [Caballeronia catudaia]
MTRGLRRNPLINGRAPQIAERGGARRCTLKAIAERNAYVAAETESWKALASSTDFATCMSGSDSAIERARHASRTLPVSARRVASAESAL